MVIYYNSVRRRNHLTRSGKLQSARSLWRHLYDNGDESSFINLTGFSRAAFEEMHQYLCGDIQEQSGPGRRRLLSSQDELGLILFYLGSSMTLSQLCLLFGCTSTRCGLIINDQLESLSTAQDPSKSKTRIPILLKKSNFWLILLIVNSQQYLM